MHLHCRATLRRSTAAAGKGSVLPRHRGKKNHTMHLVQAIKFGMGWGVGGENSASNQRGGRFLLKPRGVASGWRINNSREQTHSSVQVSHPLSLSPSPHFSLDLFRLVLLLMSKGSQSLLDVWNVAQATPAAKQTQGSLPASQPSQCTSSLDQGHVTLHRTLIPILLSSSSASSPPSGTGGEH